MRDLSRHILPPPYELEERDPLAIFKGILAGAAITALLVGLVMLGALEVRAWLHPWGS